MAEREVPAVLLPPQTLLFRAATKAAHLTESGDLSHAAFYRLGRDIDGLSDFLDPEAAQTRLNGVRAVGRLQVRDVEVLGLKAEQTPPEDPLHAVIDGLPFIDSDLDEERLLAERLARRLASMCVTVWRRVKTA